MKFQPFCSVKFESNIQFSLVVYVNPNFPYRLYRWSFLVLFLLYLAKIGWYVSEYGPVVNQKPILPFVLAANVPLILKLLEPFCGISIKSKHGILLYSLIKHVVVNGYV